MYPPLYDYNYFIIFILNYIYEDFQNLNELYYEIKLNLEMKKQINKIPLIFLELYYFF